MCAKLRTVAASNNRDHARNLPSRTLVVTFNRSQVNIGRASTSQSLLLLLARATHMTVLFFTHIPFVVNHTINATLPEREEKYVVISRRKHFASLATTVLAFLFISGSSFATEDMSKAFQASAGCVSTENLDHWSTFRFYHNVMTFHLEKQRPRDSFLKPRTSIAMDQICHVS